MELDYATDEVERLCTEAKYARRRLGPIRADVLKRRVAQIREAPELGALLQGTGRWEELKHNPPGGFSAHLDKQARIVIEKTPGNDTRATVLEVGGYHT